jgi:hypothetical protein
MRGLFERGAMGGLPLYDPGVSDSTGSDVRVMARIVKGKTASERFGDDISQR